MGNKDKRIVILVNTLELGGAEKQSVLLYDILRVDYSVSLIVLHGNRIDSMLLEMIKNKNDVTLLEGNFLSKLVKIYKKMRRDETSHLFCFLTKPNVVGGVIGKLASVEFIYGSIRSTRLSKWKMVLERIIANNFSRLTIVNSYSGSEIFKKKKFKNIITIPNCFPEIANPLIREPRKIINIISVGRFVEAKDYLTAIRCVKELVDQGYRLKYKIVGYGELEGKIREWIKKLKLQDNVEIYIKPSNIPELLSKSDVYLSTSLYEGTSNSILEAMNASLPIVATDVGDNYNMVLNDINGYLHPVSDVKSLAESLIFLIKNPFKRIDMGVKSNEILNERYSKKAFATNYKTLINGKN